MTTGLQEVLARIAELTPVPVLQPSSPTAPPASASSFASALSQAESTSTGASAYAPAVNAAADKYGLDPLLLQSLIQQESGFDPNATSAAGASTGRRGSASLDGGLRPRTRPGCESAAGRARADHHPDRHGGG